MRKALCIGVISVCIASFAYANNPKDDLTQTQAALEEARNKQKTLAQEQQRIEQEMAALQKQLVEAAANVQTREQTLAAAQEKLRILTDEQKQKKQQISKQNRKLEVLVRAALRLSQTPPEAIIMMPGDVAEQMRAARTLKMTAQTIKEEIQSIQLQLAQLADLESKITRRYSDVDALARELDEERIELEKQISARKALQQKLQQEEKLAAEQAAQLAKKAENLQGLMNALEAQKQRKQERKQQARDFAKHKGSITLPLKGKVVKVFGSETEGPEKNKGIIINASKKAKVVAPFDGEVVFAGPFLRYGNMVIIRHGKIYHSLISGLATIDVAVGEFLLEGEPIGAMGEGEELRKLYMELRQNNQPVDPKPWLGQ